MSKTYIPDYGAKTLSEKNEWTNPSEIVSIAHLRDTDYYTIRLEEYSAHLSSLKTYPAPWLPDSGPEEMVEGVDFEIAICKCGIGHECPLDNNTRPCSITAPIRKEEMKSPWPFFGYAPGNYMNTCSFCKEETHNLDKLSFVCLPCAVYVANKSIKAIVEKAPLPDFEFTEWAAANYEIGYTGAWHKKGYFSPSHTTAELFKGPYQEYLKQKGGK